MLKEAVYEFSLPGCTRQPLLLGNLPHLWVLLWTIPEVPDAFLPLIHQLQELFLVWGNLFSGYISCKLVDGIPSFPPLGTLAFGNKQQVQNPQNFIEHFCFPPCHKIFLRQETQKVRKLYPRMWKRGRRNHRSKIIFSYTYTIG